MCSQSDASGCPLWNDGATLGDGTDPIMPGNGKEEGFSSSTMCQEGVPGQTLYWILKDGSDKSFTDSGTYDFQYDAECNAKIKCQSYLEDCGGNDNQKQMERTW
eukprot:scaffold24151_cov411-Cylindrotheca_fusiformis.AAC.1